jgi:hypothetical protein
LIKTVILIYFALSTVLLVWHPVHVLKDIMVAPLFFLVPLGLGLSMVRACLKGPLEAQFGGILPILLLSLFLGLTGHTVIYQQLERLNLLQPLYPFLYPLTLCGSAYSYYREKELFCIDWSGREWRERAVIITPLVALTYSFYFLKFTRYPLRDIFQETHFMKGAMELAHFHVLNPFTADSYIPLLQVHLGLLQDWYGYDLLASQWILPVLCAVVRYASLHCFFSAVTDSRLTHTIAAGLTVITLQNLFSPTNGDMVFSVCLVLMSLLIRGWATLDVFRMVGLGAFSLMGFVVVLYKVSSVQSIGMYWALTLLGVTWYSRMTRGASSVVALGVLLCATGVALHPAVALLYLFCALGIVVIYHVVHFGWPHWPETIRVRFLIAVITVTGTMGVLFGMQVKEVFETKESRPFLNIIAEWILGKEITGAEGMRNTMIEWVRLAPPMLFVLCCLLVASWAISIRRNSPSKRMGLLGSVKQLGSCLPPAMLFAWVGCLAGLLLSFSGLPYTHRALYFPLILFCLLVAILSSEEIGRYRVEGKRVVLLKYGILVVGYLLVSGRYAYKIPDLGGSTANPYLRELTPYFGVAILGACALLACASVARAPWRVTTLVLSIVFVGVAGDKFAVKSYGYRYSYGDNWSSERPISHYTMAELELADRIRQLPSNTILLSDPYTLSIVEAQTGLNGLYSFSNLGVMREEYREAIKDILRALSESVATSRISVSEELFSRVMAFLTAYPGASPEVRYMVEHRMQRALTPQEVKKKLLIILNAERTFPWMNGQENYFPARADTAASFDELQIAKSFQVIHNIDNKVLALRLK